MRRRRSLNSVRVRCALSIAVAFVLLLGRQPGTDAVAWPDDDVPIVQIGDDEDWHNPVEELQDAFNALFDCCRDESNLAATNERLTAILRDHLSPAEWACELTDSQMQKLFLAGRGDVKRHMDYIAALKKRIEALPKLVEEENLHKLVDETSQLQTSLDSSPFGDCSLFAKTLRATLTPDQLESYEAIREIVGEEGWQRVPADEPSARQGLRLRVDEFPADKLCVLSRLKALRYLTLDGPFVTDKVLERLGDLIHLEQLDLCQSRVTDDGLWHLKHLTNLQRLRLDGSYVTGAGFKHLQDLHNLIDLWLSETEIGNDDLVHLQNLPNLRNLNLAGTKVNDAGLVHLRALLNLEWLNLADTEVTNAGLNEVKKIKSLSTLHCAQTAVTESGVAMLKRWNPSLTVKR